jgi:ribose transport system permease protein
MFKQQAKEKADFRQTWGNIWGNYSVVVVAAVIIIIASILKGGDFFSVQNFINILRNNSVKGTIALGMTLVIVSGGIDLSVGSVLVVVGAVCAAIINATNNIVLGIMSGIAMGALAGLINGIITTKGKVPSFIVTLGTMYIFRSVCQQLMSGGGFSINTDAFSQISNYRLFGLVDLPIVYFIVLTVIAYLISRHTRFGRHVYAVGSNEKATMLSAVNVDNVRILAFVFTGLMVAFASIMETSRLNSINASSSGNFYELDVIAAVVLGGTSMNGGKGSIIGTFFGVLILGIVNNMMVLIGVPPFLVGAVKGAIVVLAVLLQKKEKA